MGCSMALSRHQRGSLDFVDASTGPGGPRSIFNWDDKYVGVQVLIAKVISFLIHKLASFAKLFKNI